MCNKYGGSMCTLVFANAPYSSMQYCEACNFGRCAHVSHVFPIYNWADVLKGMENNLVQV